MSYCRWSSDKFKSDVYVYEHVDGSWTTHVAGSKRTEEYPGDDPYTLESIRSPDWQEHIKAFREWMDKTPMVPIGLAYDGKTFKDVTPQDCARTLQMLKDVGYHVPDGVIETLESEKDVS